MTDNEEKIDIVEKSHRSQIILDSLRKKYLEGVQRSQFTAGICLTYEDVNGKRLSEVERRDTRKRLSTLTPLKKKHALNPKFRFRAAVRLVMSHLVWMVADPGDKEAKKENFALQIRHIRRKKGPMSLLTFQEKMALVKHPEERTEKDIQLLAEAFSKMRSFKIYENGIHLELARTAELFCFGPNREVMRRGSPATGIYLMTSGEVSILQERMDYLTFTTSFVPVGSIGPGEMFGEVSLLYNLPRIITVVTMAVSEMVFWHKSKFDEVLLPALQKRSDQMRQIMSHFSYFRNWNEYAFRVCSTKATIEKYPRHSTIMAHNVGEKYHVHLVLRGKCHVIHHMDMVHGLNDKGKPFIPYPYDGCDVPSQCHVKTHLLNIACFRRGMIFNLGECWKNQEVLAHTDVVIMLIPIDLIEEFGAKDNIWELIQLFIKRELSDEKRIYYEYCQNMRWVKYREKLRDSIMERHRDPTNTCIRNIPTSFGYHKGKKTG